MAPQVCAVVAWNPKNVRDPEPGMDGPILLGPITDLSGGFVVTHLHALPLASFTKRELGERMRADLERLFPRGMPNEESEDGAWVCLDVHHEDTPSVCEGDVMWVWKPVERWGCVFNDWRIKKLVEKHTLPPRQDLK